jgi:hypothetical protein
LSLAPILSASPSDRVDYAHCNLANLVPRLLNDLIRAEKSLRRFPKSIFTIRDTTYGEIRHVLRRDNTVMLAHSGIDYWTYLVE